MKTVPTEEKGVPRRGPQDGQGPSLAGWLTFPSERFASNTARGGGNVGRTTASVLCVLPTPERCGWQVRGLLGRTPRFLISQ